MFKSVAMGKTIIAISCVLSLLLGIGFCVGAYFVYNAHTNTEYGVCDAEITDITEDYDFTMEEYTHTVMIKYEAGGKKYENIQLGSYDSGMKIGDTIEIKYNIENPSEIVYGNPVTIIIVVAAAGVICIIISIVIFITKVLRK